MVVETWEHHWWELDTPVSPVDGLAEDPDDWVVTHSLVSGYTDAFINEYLSVNETSC